MTGYGIYKTSDGRAETVAYSRLVPCNWQGGRGRVAGPAFYRVWNPERRQRGTLDLSPQMFHDLVKPVQKEVAA